MTRANVSKRTTKRNRRRNRASNASNLPGGNTLDGAGDIPRAPHRTYRTCSVKIPRTTQMCTFRQVTEPGEITVSASGTQNPTYQFAFSQLDNASNFGALWDQYRIDALRFHIVPNNNAIQVPTTSTTNFVQMYCVIDYDDTSTLSTAAAARDYDNCVVLEPGESLVREFKPHAALAAYAGAFNNYANVASPWIDLSSTGVQHYGIKLFIPQATVGQTILQSWNLQVEFFVSLRSIR